jgi:hypothetical protein
MRVIGGRLILLALLGAVACGPSAPASPAPGAAKPAAPASGGAAPAAQPAAQAPNSAGAGLGRTAPR